MVNDWYTSDKCHILKAKKMSTWRNSDAKLQAADVQKMDELIEQRLFEPIGIAEEGGGSAIYIPKMRTTRYLTGRYQEILYFQTGMQLYESWGSITTVDDTPSAGLYTHTGALRTTQTPTNQGRHLERENITDAESERIDLLGMLCRLHHLECSEAAPTAIQTLDWDVAFTKNTATDDIAPAVCDDKAFEWSDFSFPTFTYNSETIEADIIGWALDIFNTPRVTALDTNGYYTKGKYIPPTRAIVTLQIMPYGRNAFELIRTILESYATDLDLVVKTARHSTNDLVQFTHDKLYCTPFDLVQIQTTGNVEIYFMRMHQLSTGSMVPIIVDDYDDDYYEL